jgi:peptidyl-prolyl cis-trans isomerase A (cyclophilin A)
MLTASLLFALPAWAQKVRLATTAGDIVIELDHEKAPKTVDNFLQYVRAGHYNGVVFHRVIDNFMIQTGGYKAEKGELVERPPRKPIPLESRNGLLNVKGSVAMARGENPNSAAAQFFINVNDNVYLDQANARDGEGYAVFGMVVEGMDVVDKIKTVPTAPWGPHQNLPVTPVTIRKASVEK